MKMSLPILCGWCVRGIQVTLIAFVHYFRINQYFILLIVFLLYHYLQVMCQRQTRTQIILQERIKF